MNTEHSLWPTVRITFALLCFAHSADGVHALALTGRALFGRAQVHCLDDPSEPHVAFTRNIHETVTSVELGFVSNAQSVPLRP